MERLAGWGRGAPGDQPRNQQRDQPRNRSSDQPHNKSQELVAAMNEVVALVTDLSERLAKMESLYARLNERSAEPLPEHKGEKQTEQSVSLHGCTDASIFTSKEFKQAMAEVKDDLLKAMARANSEWKDKMVVRIQECQEIAETARRDVDAVISRTDKMTRVEETLCADVMKIDSKVDAMDKQHLVNSISVLKYSLRSSKLPPDSIDMCLQKLETREEHLKSKFDIRRAAEFKETLGISSANVQI